MSIRTVAGAGILRMALVFQAIQNIQGRLKDDANLKGPLKRGTQDYWYEKGARETCLALRADVKELDQFQEIVNAHPDREAQIKALCEYAQELDAERLNVICRIRELQAQQPVERSADNGKATTTPRRARATIRP